MGHLFCCFKKDVPTVDATVKDNKCCIDDDCRCVCCLIVVNKNENQNKISNRKSFSISSLVRGSPADIIDKSMKH